MALLESSAFVEVTASMAAPLRGKKRWAYLEREKTIRLATTEKDGSIYLSSLWYVIKEETIYLPIDAGGRHAVNFDGKRNFKKILQTFLVRITVLFDESPFNFSFKSSSKNIVLINHHSMLL